MEIKNVNMWSRLVVSMEKLKLALLQKKAIALSIILQFIMVIHGGSSLQSCCVLQLAQILIKWFVTISTIFSESHSPNNSFKFLFSHRNNQETIHQWHMIRCPSRDLKSTVSSTSLSKDKYTALFLLLFLQLNFILYPSPPPEATIASPQLHHSKQPMMTRAIAHPR